jgi:L-arabinokinase
VISNFTWDWIYAEYAEYLDRAPALLPTIQAAYRTATAAWRLPMYGGFESFDEAWRADAPEARGLLDVPFVARHARHSREETCGRLALPLDRRLALVSFGGYGAAGLPLDRLDCRDEWTVVLTSHETARPSGKGVCVLNEKDLYGAGFRYEDVVAACDAVVSKPGYGIISECLANNTPLVYTSRGRFAEYPVLVGEMPRVLRCAYLDQDSLLAGRWLAALDAAVAMPAPPERPATNGAEVIADMIAVHDAL